MRELLRNEVAACWCGPARFVDNPGDGNEQGQDAETTRASAGNVTDAFIPVGTTIWQYKAERRAPSETELKEEIEKDRPKEVLSTGGSYRFVAQQPRTNESVKQTLLQRIATRKGYRADQVGFHAQATLAERARLYPSLALLPFFRRPLEDVQSFEWWDDRYSATKFDEKARSKELSQLLEFIRSAVRPAHVRVVGPAGVGKTRLVLQALTQLDLGACTAYAPSPRTSGFNAFFKWCGDHKGRLTLVVDECDEATAMQLRTSIVEHELPILLVTINKVEDRDIRAGERDLRVHLDPMNEDDIVRILDDGSVDKSRLFAIAHLTGGFVKLARVVAQAVARDRNSVFDLSSLVTVDVIRDAVRSLLAVPEAALRWFGAVALFSEVRVDTTEPGSEFARVTEFAGVSVQDARAWNARAITEQVLSDRGDRIFVTPALLAVLLARDFVRVRRADLPDWLRGLPTRLQESFATQLGQLRYSEEGRALARELMDTSGPFGDLLAERQPWARDAFLALGSVARPEALDRLERWLEEVPEAAGELATDRALQRLLFRLVWRPEHFARAFRLIVRGLEASTDPIQSGLARILTGSQRLTLANSQAPFPDRLAVAARAVRDTTLRVENRRLIMRALASGTGRGGGDGYSTEDVDISGREYWYPATYGEWRACIRSVVQLLVDMLSDGDAGLRKEAASNLIDHAAEFILGRAHEPLLAAIGKVLEIDPRVGTLREELERSIAFDKLPEDVGRAVRDAIAALPQDLAARIRVLVEGFPLVRDRDARGLPRRPNAEDVADEIMNDSSRDASIGMLFEPWAKNSGDILVVLAKRPDAPVAWRVILHAARAHGETWGAALFLAVAHDAGLLSPVPVELLTSGEEFERSLGAETITRMEASDDDVRALIAAIREGRVTPGGVRYAVMGRWTERRGAAVVADLIRAVADSPGGAIAALAITHAAEANLGLNDDDLVRLLVSAMFDVHGHDAWTWEQVGYLTAKRAPYLLGRALVTQIAEVTRMVRNRYFRWAADEVARVIDRCIEEVPTLVASLLELWDVAPEFVESFATSSILEHLDAAALGAWATDDRRQQTIAKIVVAAPHPTTEALVAQFGPDSTFARKLREQLYPRSWSGSLRDILRSRADAARAWAADATKSADFREWARTSASWLDQAAERARRYDD